MKSLSFHTAVQSLLILIGSMINAAINSFIVLVQYPFPSVQRFIQFRLFSLLYLNLLVGCASANTYDEANAKIHSNRHGLILVAVNVEMTVPLLDYDRQDGRYSVSVEEIQAENSMPFSQTIIMKWNKLDITEKIENYTASYATGTKEWHRDIIHYSGGANCTFMIPLMSHDVPSQAHSAPQGSSSLSRTFIVSLNLTPHITSHAKNQNENNWRRGQETIVLTRRLATLPREMNSRSQRPINPVTNVFLHHSQRITHQELTQISQSDTLEDNGSISRPDAIDTRENGNKESAQTIDDRGSMLWTFVLLCSTYLIQSRHLQDKVKSLIGSTYIQPISYGNHSISDKEHEAKDPYDGQYSHDHAIGGECIVNEDCSDRNTDKESIATDHQRDEAENVLEQDRIDTERAHEPVKIYHTDQHFEENDMEGNRVCVIPFAQKNQSFAETDDETGYNPYQMVQEKESKMRDSREKLNEAEAHSYDILDRNTDTHEVKLKRSEPSLGEDNPSTFQKDSTCSKQIQATNHVTDDWQSEKKQDEKRQNDPDLSNDGCQGVGQCSNKNSLLKDSTNCEHYCNIQCQGIGMVDATKVAKEEKGEEIGRCEKTLPNTSELEVADISLTTKDICDTFTTPGSPGSQQSLKLEKCKIAENREKCETSAVQGYESEESYVSTLPPDSDYESDEDHPLLLLSSQRPTFQDVNPMSKKNSTNNDLECIPTNASSRKRAKISPRLGIPSKGNSIRDPQLDKELHDKEGDLESVEVVRVVKPVDRVEKRTKRPYRKSNYVADWVPSNELQSMSHHFLEEESWDMIAPTKRDSSSTSAKPLVKESEPPKSKKKKPNPSLSSSSASSFAARKRRVKK